MRLINKGPKYYETDKMKFPVGIIVEVTEDEGRRILRDFLGATCFHFVQADYVPASERKADQSEKITVMMPVYNREKFIRESLRSILDQTYRNLEIIVYDDASTDKTSSILSEIAASDKRVKIITGKKNIGVGAARQKLMGRCKSGLAAWQDSDDVAYPERIERQAIAMQDLRKRFPEKKFIVYCGWEYIDEEGKRTQDGNYHQFNCSLFMKDENTPAIPDMRWGEDMKWHDALIDAGYSESHVYDVLQGYRQHDGSLTRQRVREGKAS